MKKDSVLPTKIETGKHFQSTIGFLFNTLENENDTIKHKTIKQTILGLSVPWFQRGIVWTEDQQVKFIESLLRGVPIGTFTINKECLVEINGELHETEISNIILDGQQRLRSIERFINNEIKACGIYFKDFTKSDLRIFKNTFKFEHYVTEFQTIEECIDYYNTFNFGGTKHTQQDYVLSSSPNIRSC